MANIRIGSHPSHKFQLVESITEAKQLTPADSGKYFVFDQGAYTINLPKMSVEIAGWQATLSRRTHANSQLKVSKHSDDSANIYYLEKIGDVSSVATAISNIKVATSGDAAEVPLWIKIKTDGSYWYLDLFAKDGAGFDAAD